MQAGKRNDTNLIDEKETTLPQKGEDKLVATLEGEVAEAMMEALSRGAILSWKPDPSATKPTLRVYESTYG